MSVLRRTVTVGPVPIFFTNINKAMGLPGHSHTGAVTLVYDTLGPHGYPSFETTNRALEERVHDLTGHVFRDATNEDVVDRLWGHLHGWVSPVWEPWGGEYRLRALHLDVVGVRDAIGHDAGTTRYTVERVDEPQGAGR